MTDNCVGLTDDNYDAAADTMIATCVTAAPPISFFLFAGAGSGKTRSLVYALRAIKAKAGSQFRLSGRRVGVITFTNKACDEIRRRIEDDPLFSVSTIHSFSWSMIKGLDHDIREWLKNNLQMEITELKEKQAKGRFGTKAATDRENAIAAKVERIINLADVKRFTYNPDGDNPGRDALNHAEVIGIVSSFLLNRPLMSDILVSRFPILLIDESQDTNKELIDALLDVQVRRREQFALGIIGDAMQRIYMAGRSDLGNDLPKDWETPIKRMNHRSCHRIIKLVNRIRQPVDGQEQRARADKGEGYVRFFVLSTEISDKPIREHEICRKMASITGDDAWLKPEKHVKTLILEHRMAANRLGFLPMWDALSGIDRLQTGLRDGTLPGLRFFSHVVLPLVNAQRSGDRFAVGTIVRRHSPLLDRDGLTEAKADQKSRVDRAREAVESLAQVFSCASKPTFLRVLRSVHGSGLFDVPDVLRPFALDDGELTPAPGDERNGSGDDLAAWRAFLETPFEQIAKYSQYIQGEAPYDTHQGIKGLEFPRVCVIMDDAEARGFTFSYEKLFGAKANSARRDSSSETAADRTRRLFYVTCSRAQNSLALIAYTSRIWEVRNHVINEGWFDDSEVELTV